MQDEICCGRLMYQEIGRDNYLLSICKTCGKTKKMKVNFTGSTQGKDGLHYANLSVENFNAKLMEDPTDG